MRISTLKMGDMRHLLTEMTEKQQYLLNRALRKVRGQAKNDPGARMISKRPLKPSQAEGRRGQRRGRRFQYRSCPDVAYRSSVSRTALPLTIPSTWTCRRSSSRVNVPCCNSMKSTSVTSRWSWQRCCAVSTRRAWIPSVAKYILASFTCPIPSSCLLEEAHHFAPGGTDVVSTSILKQVLAEGRKFGIGVGLISQRPAS